MTKAIKNITNPDGLRPFIFRLLSFGAFLAVFSYIYLISSTVTSTVGGEKTAKKITEIKHEIIELEKNYMNESSKLDEDFAAVSGFGQPEKVIYVSRFDIVAQK